MADSHHEKEEEAEESLRPIIVGLVISCVAVVGLAFLASYLFESQLRAFATWLVEAFGVWGLALGIFLSDAFTAPIPPDTYLLLGVASDISPYHALPLLWLTSVIAGSVAYWIGPLARRLPFVGKRLRAFETRGKALFKKWGWARWHWPRGRRCLFRWSATWQVSIRCRIGSSFLPRSCEVRALCSSGG